MASFFKSRLGGGIGLCYQRSGFAPPKTHAPEQSLALSCSQAHLIFLAQMVGEQLAVPEVLAVTQIARMATQVLFYSLPRLLIQTPRASFALAFMQTLEASHLEAVDPAFNGGRVFPQPLAHVIATVALANQQNPVKPVVIPGFIGPTNLLSESDFHCLSIGDSQRFHASSAYLIHCRKASPLCCITYDAVYNSQKVLL